jgi:hypothetical protein
VPHRRGDVGGELRPRALGQRRRRRARVVDAEEDTRVAGALDDAAEDVDLRLRRRVQPRLPEARDPDGLEAGVLQLLQRRPLVPDDVVYRSNQ